MPDFLLDTDTCIYLLKGHPGIKERIRAVSFSHLAISSITVAELYYGAFASQQRERNLQRVIRFLARPRPKLLTLDESIARMYGKLKSSLRQSGKPLADFDILIASTAIQTHATLVTHNVRHFARIPGLKLEDWYAAPP